MRHNALSAIAAATRCGGSGVSCRLQPGRAVAVDSCSLQLGTENNNSTYYSFRDQWLWMIHFVSKYVGHCMISFDTKDTQKRILYHYMILRKTWEKLSAGARTLQSHCGRSSWQDFYAPTAFWWQPADEEDVKAFDNEDHFPNHGWNLSLC